jgi:DNA-binding NtrC family response regulator
VGEPEKPGETQGPGRVLVVDDDANARDALEAVLGADFEVVVARGVGDALRILGEQSFDALVSDFELQDGNGANLLAIASERFPNVIGVLITGHIDSPEVRTLQKSGRALVLFKPAKPAELIAWVRNSVAMSRLQRLTENLRRRSGGQGA